MASKSGLLVVSSINEKFRHLTFALSYILLDVYVLLEANAAIGVLDQSSGRGGQRPMLGGSLRVRSE